MRKYLKIINKTWTNTEIISKNRQNIWKFNKLEKNSISKFYANIFIELESGFCHFLTRRENLFFFLACPEMTKNNFKKKIVKNIWKFNKLEKI